MSEVIQIPRYFEPRPYQIKALQALEGVEGRPETRKRFAILMWARRHGKDITSWAFMIKRAILEPGNYYYVFPTAKDARRAIWEGVRHDGIRYMDMIPPEFIDTIREHDLYIRFKNGSSIRMFGFDNKPDNIRGISAKGAIFSEWAYSNPEVLNAFMPSITQTKGWLIIPTTPNGKNHLYHMVQRVKDDKDWYVSTVQALYPNQPDYYNYVTLKDIKAEQLVTGASDEEIAVEYGCSFEVTTSGNFYAHALQKARAEGRIREGLYRPYLPVYTYWDLGASDTEVCWFAQHHGENTYFINHKTWKSAGLAEVVMDLKSLGYEYDTHVLPHDAGHLRNGENIHVLSETFQRLIDEQGVGGEVFVNSKPKSVWENCKSIRADFHKFHFDETDCAEGIELLRNHSQVWNKAQGRYIEKFRAGEPDHTADAFRQQWETEQFLKYHYDGGKDIEIVQSILDSY